jgi:hypothetical protein
MNAARGVPGMVRNIKNRIVATAQRTKSICEKRFKKYAIPGNTFA